MINIALTVGGFVLLKGVFLMLFAREHCEIAPIPQLDASNTLHIELSCADYKGVSETDVAA